MRPLHPIALFRLSVLGPLASREQFQRGELKRLIGELAQQRYDIPHSQHVYLSAKTVEAWYYRWLKGGIEALEPKSRCDRGQSKLSPAIQKAIIDCKEDNPKRSIDTIKTYIEEQGLVANHEVSRSSIHRLLKQKGLSGSAQAQIAIERRRFEATHAGDSWYGDVMHGPRLMIDGRQRKTYLVSLMDDASRLITHGAFCLGEKALDIEGVLKQALLKRGLCAKLVVDNGAAYRAQSLQGICARLEIRLIYCRPYEPQSKGKLERWHRVVRQQFLSEIDTEQCAGLSGLNARLWAWIDSVYHQRAHSALKGLSPLQRFQQDISHLHQFRQLGQSAGRLDEIFYHRVKRKVKKDGTIAYEGNLYEVPYELIGQQVMLVLDPHRQHLLFVESVDGAYLGGVTALDAHANNTRKRVRTEVVDDAPSPCPENSLVEQALQRQTQALSPSSPKPARKMKVAGQSSKQK